MVTNLFLGLQSCLRGYPFPVSFELPFPDGSKHLKSARHLAFASVVLNCCFFAAAVAVVVAVVALVAAVVVAVVVAVVAAVVVAVAAV